ncbi:MAG: hypothetical protein V1820_04770 [archaeon]
MTGRTKKRNYILSAAERNFRPEEYYKKLPLKELERELAADWVLASLLPETVLVPATVFSQLTAEPFFSPDLPNYSNIAHFHVSFAVGQACEFLSEPGARRLFAGASAAVSGATEGQDIATAFPEKLNDSLFDAAADVFGFYFGLKYQGKVNSHFRSLAGKYSRVYHAPVLGMWK